MQNNDAEALLAALQALSYATNMKSRMEAEQMKKATEKAELMQIMNKMQNQESVSDKLAREKFEYDKKKDKSEMDFKTSKEANDKTMEALKVVADINKNKKKLSPEEQESMTPEGYKSEVYRPLPWLTEERSVKLTDADMVTEAITVGGETYYIPHYKVPKFKKEMGLK